MLTASNLLRACQCAPTSSTQSTLSIAQTSHITTPLLPPLTRGTYVLRTHLKQCSQDFKPTYWPNANFHFLDLTGFWARPIQSPLAWTPTRTTSTLRSTASQSGGSELSLQNIWTLPLQWLRSPSVREPQLSSTRCGLAGVETSSGAHNFYLI